MMSERSMTVPSELRNPTATSSSERATGMFRSQSSTALYLEVHLENILFSAPLYYTEARFQGVMDE